MENTPETSTEEQVAAAPAKKSPEAFQELVKGREDEVRKLLKEQDYLAIITPLQEELVKLQTWVKNNGVKLMIIFEGRDAAGKGGTIKRFAEHLNPRLFRIVALDKPTDKERTQWYFQRYIQHLPSGGEMVFFDRSWYNRAGVERVMNFCTEDQAEEFYRSLPDFERMLVRSGIHMFKFWFSVTKKSQEKRFTSRETDPLKGWKLSPVDQEAQDRWDAYTRVSNDMLRRSSIPEAPWTVIRSDDKKMARINSMRYILSKFPYDGKREELLTIDRSIIRAAEEELSRSK